MNTLLASLSGKKTYLTVFIAGLLLFCQWQGWIKIPTEFYAALSFLGLAFLRSAVNRVSSPDPAPNAQPVKMTILPPASSAVLLVLSAASFLAGCAPLKPGVNALVVNVERTETLAKSTFDLVLNVDNSQRGFYATNAPEFHKFCQWLRRSQTVEGTNTLPRAAAILVSLDDVKLAYESGSASSNELVTALSTVTETLNQAAAWSTLLVKPK
jgi:hypothetical protein